MRIEARPTNLTERFALLANLAPVPVGESFYGPAMARALQVAVRTGMLAALAERPRTAAELATDLELSPPAAELLLDVIASLGHLELDRDGCYRMSSRAKRWLDPGSDRYVGDFIADNHHYWEWWGGLEDLVRAGHSVDLHDRPADDPYWRSYIRGQFELARLSSAEVASAVGMAKGATSLLDVAGAHGEFSMALCRRHEGLRATIVDLPGSAAVGREIVAEEGMSDRVRHVDGDMFETDLGGPHDGGLLFNIVHHLSPDEARRIFSRMREALRPGAPLCVLDLYRRKSDERPDSGAILGLFFHLTSGAETYSTEEISGWLRESGFGPARRKRFRTLPDLALLRAEAA